MHIKSNREWAVEKNELLDALYEFAAVMERRPFQNEAGLRGVSAFALYWYVKNLQPELIFEVGVWRGFTTWLLEQAAPDAELWSFDPLFFFGGEPAPTYRSPHAKYFREDFSCADLRGVVVNPERTLAFFDDHHRQLARVEQCRRVGIEHIVFDDNPPFPYSNRTLEDERRDADGNRHLDELLRHYEVFPALWPVEDAHEYPVVEAGLGFPLTPELNYLFSERKWHSYVTYVRATRATETEMNRSSSESTATGHLHSVQLQSRPSPSEQLPSSQPAGGADLADLVAQLATSSAVALNNLNTRLNTVEATVRARMDVAS